MTDQMEILTEGGWEKKPSFAPNGKLIMFASEARVVVYWQLCPAMVASSSAFFRKVAMHANRCGTISVTCLNQAKGDVMKKLIISVVLLNLLAACATEKPKETVAPPAAAAAPAAETPVAAAPETAEKAAPAAVSAIDQLNDSNSILAKRSTYYPFDVSVVQEADKPLVQAHAKYLSENAESNVRLEGNCDERGSNEYNLGLGQRRADV